MRRGADPGTTSRRMISTHLSLARDKYDLNLYLKSIQIVRAVDDYLDTLNLETIHRRNMPYYVCMYATCAKAGNAYAPPNEILKIDVSTFTSDFLHDCYERVHKHYERLAERYRA